MIQVLILTATLVCAEAETTTNTDQRAVAAVVLNRARLNNRTIPRVIYRPRQFAALTYCNGGVQPRHVLNTLAGWLGVGLPDWFDHTVTHFVAPYALTKVKDRWSKRLRLAGRVEGGHVYWKRPSAL